MALKRKVALINLNSKEIRSKDIPPELRGLYLGGRGVGSFFLYHFQETGFDSPDSDDLLIINAGLLTGTPAPAANQVLLSGRSPLSGFVGHTVLNGFFGPELRFAGFDHLIIQGQSDHPIYLWIHNGEIEIREASELWGPDILKTQHGIRQELGDDDIQVVAIGLAGENRVRFATAGSGLRDPLTCAGMGAIMGSKRLKAIAARGTLPIEIASPDQAVQYLTRFIKFKRSTKPDDPSEDDNKVRAAKALCGNLGENILTGSDYFALLGLDSLKTCGMISWYLALQERDFLPRSISGNSNLNVMSEAAMLNLVNDIAHRRGLGNILAEGPGKIIAQIESDRVSQALAIPALNSLFTDMRLYGNLYGQSQQSVKKMHDGKEAAAKTPGKIEMIFRQECLYSVLDTLGIGAQAVSDIRQEKETIRILEAITALNLSVEDLLAVGERIGNIERLTNIRHGYRPEDDMLHNTYLHHFSSQDPAFNKEPIPNIEALNDILSTYYEIHGWDAYGNPRQETLERLGLDQKIDALF
ncbi:aldehyde ferredoxin oxidoreductase N-terminal domain-containing protein [Thermodesulfobacteriota bacterium]